jgi:hypothetical protein
MDTLHQTARAVPAKVVDYYTWPIMLWAAGLLFLFGADMAELHFPSGGKIGIELGLWLCYPLAIWNGAVSAWWAWRATQRRAAGEITAEEGTAGVKYIGHLLAQTAAAPAIIFLASEPLLASSWATCASIAITSGAAYGGVSALVRLPSRTARAMALVLGCLALPINATGAVSLAWWMGLFDPIVTPVVDLVD